MDKADALTELVTRLDTPLLFPGPEPDFMLPKELWPEYKAIKWTARHGWCGVHRLMFHWTVHYGIDDTSIAGRYCYQTEVQATVSLAMWDGEGDPPGDWHKHPPSGRRRDPKTGEIWHESEDNARAIRNRQHSAGE